VQALFWRHVTAPWLPGLAMAFLWKTLALRAAPGRAMLYETGTYFWL
jgi:hypothetical protein